MKTIKVLILAISYKTHGKCVAGIDLSSQKKWKLVRLIQDNPDRPEFEDSIPDEKLIGIQKLDIVECEVESVERHLPQTENVKLVGELRKIGRAGRKTAHKFYYPKSKNSYLLDTDEESYVKPSELGTKVKSSLELIKVQYLHFYKKANADGKQKAKVEFEFDGKMFKDISMTDPDYYSYCQADLTMLYATVLLSLPRKAVFNKLAASIFDRGIPEVEEDQGIYEPTLSVARI